MRTHLTAKRCRELPPPAKGNTLSYDSEVRGLALRVTAKGARSWVLNYIVNGRERRLTIGRLDEWPPAKARQRAREIRREIDEGHDPLDEKRRQRQAETFESFANRYLRDHAKRHKRPASYRDDERYAAELSKRWKDRPLASITRADVREMHNALADIPRGANKRLAFLSKLFAHAIAEEIEGITENPVKGIPRHPEKKRTRFLSADELPRFLRALDEAPDDPGYRAFTLQLLTGCRIGEALSMRWANVDLDRGVWTKPASTTKTKKDHHLPLSPQIIEKLAAWRREAVDEKTGELRWPHVFARNGKAIGYPREAWRRICKAAELKDLRPHDLRHSYASLLVQSGVPLALVGGLLGHETPTTTARYAHHADDPLREATGRFGDIVDLARKADG